MKVLIACEQSGIVREAFKKVGIEAWSCDILPSEIYSSKHYQGDVLDILDDRWDMMIAHPPCTHLAVSGARWFKDKVKEQKEAIDFFMKLVNAPIPKICVENPISIMSTKYRKPDQIIQPWMFGHGETKATCLWLKGLPKLNPTNIVDGRDNNVHKGCGFGWNTIECKKARSKTFQGIADAMVDQWGSLEIREDNGGVGQWESTPPREGDVGGSNPPTVKERENSGSSLCNEVKK